MTARTSTIKSIANKIAHSPLIHFTLLGGLAYWIFVQVRPEKQDKIIVSKQISNALIKQQEELQAFPVSPEQKAAIIDSYIDDEVMIQEAKKRNLVTSDGRVRKRVLNMMRSSFSELVPPPTYTQLLAFYEENKQDYVKDTSWSFIHVFFNINSDKLPPDSLEFIRLLGLSSDPSSLGDYFTSGNIYRNASRSLLHKYFGKAFTNQLVKQKLNEWNGPLTSLLGKHYVKIIEKNNPVAPTFDEIERYVRQDYEFKKIRAIQQRKIAALRDNYNIIIEEEHE